MNRRDLLKAAAFASVAAPLKALADGDIPVAFLISEGAVIIDFCGPWEVFQDAGGFSLFTVSESRRPIRASGGMQIVPDYDFASAPAAKVVVIPAQRGSRSKAAVDWLRKTAAHADLTMSVCTGAFVLAGAGLLGGRPATTHHSSYAALATQFPEVKVQRGARFVDDGNVASAGGLTSGIDLALHIVERYRGRDAAKSTADYMEYQGKGWLDPSSNADYAPPRKSESDAHTCPVCGMAVDPASAPRSRYRGGTYAFCSIEHKQLFDAAPDKVLELAR